MRRVAEIEEDREKLALALLEQLRQPPTTGPRLRAGAQIALEAGLFGEARSLAETAWRICQTGRPRLSDGSRSTGSRGFRHGFGPLAYEVLRVGATDDAETRALDQNITVAALATGDTARALEAQHAIADGLPAGSTVRQRALAEILRLGIERGGLGVRESLARSRGNSRMRPNWMSCR